MKRILLKFSVYLSALCITIFATLQTLFLFLLNLISPSLTKQLILKMGEKVTMTQNPKFKYEDWGPTFMSFIFIKTVIRHTWVSLGDEAFVGSKGPDTPVVTLDGKKTSVYNFMKGRVKRGLAAKTLMTLAEELREATGASSNERLFKTLVKDFSDVADFLIVYIAEAHSTDGWAFTNNVAIKKHQDLKERIVAAQLLAKEDPLCTIVVDEMFDTTAAKYAALPERLYVLEAGKVVYKGGKGPWGYDPMEVHSFLQKKK